MSSLCETERKASPLQLLTFLDRKTRERLRLIALVSEGHLDDEQKFKNALEGSLFLACIPFNAALPSMVLAEENLQFKRRLKSRIYGRKDRLQRFGLLIEDIVYEHDEAWQA